MSSPPTGEPVDPSRFRVRFAITIGGEWLRLDPVRVGPVPAHLPTPDRFVVVERDEEPLLRIDLYAPPGESGAARKAIVWRGRIAVSWGRWLHLVDLGTRDVRTLDLSAPFEAFHPEEDALRVTTSGGGETRIT
ncbi:MAG: hypothetical protein HY720_05860 [Planctomycetes bacterium]|nr:hypothetical protein [Planctomycetota bacterium]